MQVAVEDAVEHGALHERHEARVQHRLGVDAGLLHRLHVVPRDPVEPFHHEHAPGHERGVRPGHDRGALLGLGEHARDVEHVLRFEAEVELLDDRLREQLDQRGRVGERGHRDATDEMRREPRHRLDVLAHEPRDLRALHLDDDVFAGAQPCRVHLRDRRRRDRRALERREHVVEGAAELELDDAAHVVERLGRHAVAEQLELGDELFGEQALAARDDLAELDVGGPEVPEREPQPARQVAAGVRRSLAPGADGPQRERAADAPDDPGQRGRAVAAGRSPSSAGTRPGPARRRRSTSPRHVIASGSTTHGPWSVNDPIARSAKAGGSAIRSTIGAPGACPRSRRPQVRASASAPRRNARHVRPLQRPPHGAAPAWLNKNSASWS